MRILACPDKLKGSLDAAAAARAIAAGVRRGSPSAIVDECPLADGGEGTLAALAPALGAELKSARVTSPLGEKIDARFAINQVSKVAIVESAEALGLARVPDTRRNPEATTSYGLGELIVAALDAGARKIIVGLGGSATTDGGAGMAQALGVVFRGVPIPICGRDLANVEAIDFGARDPRVEHTVIVGAFDVENPLLGERGAALMFAPQKGATAAQARALDAGLRHLAKLVPEIEPDRTGAGAAGGLGFGLATFAGATLTPGGELVLDAVDFDVRLGDADFVITGEGRLDAQSLEGKVVRRVAERARRAGKPVAVIAGSVALSTEELATLGVIACSLVGPGISENEARARAAELVADRAAELSRKLARRSAP